MSALSSRVAQFYKRYEWQSDVCFFLSGFLFDVFTLAEVDDLWSLFQQVFYLVVSGSILFVSLRRSHSDYTPPPWVEKYWQYSSLIFHFMLGGLLSVYSLFFIKSSSFFASIVFVGIVLSLLILNELKIVQKNQGQIKTAFFVLCLLLFFLIMVPTALGFVGFFPSILAYALTALAVFCFVKLLSEKIANSDVEPDIPTVLGGMKPIEVKVFRPSAIVIGGFFFLDLMAWVPPVPVALQEIGIYHNIQKENGSYLLSHERPWWRIWHSGDQKFYAQEGDQIFIFARIYSPARFEDEILLHWHFDDPKVGWMSTDRIPIAITGGRKEGFRGFAYKSNFAAGDWMIKVETQHGRELGRISLEVVEEEELRQRDFKVDRR